MGLFDFCGKFSKALDVEPPNRDDIEKRVHMQIDEEIKQQKLSNIKSELEELCPNPYDSRSRLGSAYYMWYSDRAHGYGEAISDIAKVIYKGSLHD